MKLKNIILSAFIATTTLAANAQSQKHYEHIKTYEIKPGNHVIPMKYDGDSLPDLIVESEINESVTVEIKQTEKKTLSPTIMYKSNDGNGAKLKDRAKNSLWSKLKNLWT